MQHFEIPFRLPGLNEITAQNRRNRYAGAQQKRETEAGIIMAIRKARLEPVTPRYRLPVVVEMVFHEPNRKRDVDNVESAKKFILDALVKSGVLPGDSPRYVRAVPSYTAYDVPARVDVCILTENEWRERNREHHGN